jgi:aryl-alcohol dehydrogenase-like predicted oxidoreductase
MTTSTKIIPAQATSTATQNFTSKFPFMTYHQLGTTGLSVSQASFGTYRFHQTPKNHRDALKNAFEQGINLLETSPNYADGLTESIIGQILSDFFKSKLIKRQELIIITKGGYLQGKKWALSQEKKKNHQPFQELVEYDQALEHCIHPEFLTYQISQSLTRLKIKTIDGYLLHNPEYYLRWCQNQHLDVKIAQKEYYQRLKNAFIHLESEVAQGRIGFYGISSNTFTKSHLDYTFTSLSELLNIARSINPNHHFKIIQFPMNLCESNAATLYNQPNKQSLLSYAHKHRLGVIIKRPLNALINYKFIRLSSKSIPSLSKNEINSLIHKLQEMEAKLNQLLENSTAHIEDLSQEFIFGQELQAHWQEFQEYEQWKNILSQFFLPRIESAVQTLSSNLNNEEVLHNWLHTYLQHLNQTAQAISDYYKSKLTWRALAIQKKAKQADQAWAEAPNLTQMAIRALRTTQGISSILVGMRTEDYVEDIIKELKQHIPIKPRTNSWQNLN